MKYKGATMEYSQERSDDLMRAYDAYMESCDYIRMPEVYSTIVNMPSKRFWVSGTRAAIVVSAIVKNGLVALKGMRPTKKEMYLEIYNRVQSLAKEDTNLTIQELCEEVTSQPAPKFYLSPGSAKLMVCKAREEWIHRKLERLHLL